MADWFTHDDRMRILGIDEETFRTVAEVAPLLRDNVDRIAAAFYDRVVKPSFSRARGIVYLLPEVLSLESVFKALAKPAPRPAAA